MPLPPPPCVSVVSLSVSPDDGSGTSSRAVEIGLFIGYFTNLLGVVCVGVELAVVFRFVGFFPAGFPIKDLGFFTAGFFPWGRLASFP